jgi:hypothetical protein
MADINDRVFLEECFDLDIETGSLTWKVRPQKHFNTSHGCNIFNAQKAGNCADRVGTNGYKKICVNNRVVMLSHRVVFLLVNGFLPEYVDHIDGDRANNTPSNLRSATASNNSYNTRSHKGSTSKYKGVSWNKQCSLWAVYCADKRLGNYCNGKTRQAYLGLFSSEVSAALAYDKYASNVHGEFICLNRDNFVEVMIEYRKQV